MTALPLFVREIPGGVLLSLKVQPGSSIDQWVGLEGSLLKIKLQAPPQQGAANQALRKFFRKIFKIPLANIKIRRGEKSRIKEVEILGLTGREFLTKLQDFS